MTNTKKSLNAFNINSSLENFIPKLYINNNSYG